MRFCPHGFPMLDTPLYRERAKMGTVRGHNFIRYSLYVIYFGVSLIVRAWGHMQSLSNCLLSPVLTPRQSPSNL